MKNQKDKQQEAKRPYKKPELIEIDLLVNTDGKSNYSVNEATFFGIDFAPS